MGIFPQSFIDDLKMQVDIVEIIKDYVPLKRAGTSYKGLCPFHSEKTPSFTVNKDKGFFHCFGCGTGGDVFKFLELQGQVSFQDAVRQLANRVGLSVPEIEKNGRSAADNIEREELLKVHEIAANYFCEHLNGRIGKIARQQIQERGLTPQTIETLRLGLAPASRGGLTDRLLQHGFSRPLVLRSGLAVKRENGQIVDRFRNRLMVPISRENGPIIAFAGRAIEPSQQPKYLNSPETVIYSKGRVLYGLHLTKAAIRKQGYAVLVEGYFDFAQVLQAGVKTVVALCGTALSVPQARVLRRSVTKVILNFDPDPAGQGASTRSGELLLSEGFQVNIVVLSPGEDPDTFLRKHGSKKYLEKLRSSQPYLEYMLDLAASAYDFSRDGGRRAFVDKMLNVAARIPDAATRDLFGDRLAHKARITEDVVRSEIRKAAVARRTTMNNKDLPMLGEIRPAEKGLIWALLRNTESALAALSKLEDEDLKGLATAPILQAARALGEWPIDAVPNILRERLSESESDLVSSITSQDVEPAPADQCVKALKKLSFERERTALQDEINRLQTLNATEHTQEIDDLWKRKKDLLHRIEELRN